MIEIDLDTAMRLAREVIEDKGEDYVYESPWPAASCFYVHTPNQDDRLTRPVPGCIVGHILHKAGISLDILSEVEQHYAPDALAMLRKKGEVTPTTSGDHFLELLQWCQDLGRPWGKAYRYAVERTCPPA